MEMNNIKIEKLSLLEKQKWFDCYTFENDYIGNILAKLFTETTDDEYKYYRYVSLIDRLYTSYAEEEFKVSVVTNYPILPDETFASVEFDFFRGIYGLTLDRKINPGFFILDRYSNSRIKNIEFKPELSMFASRLYWLHTSTSQIFSTPYGEFIDDLAYLKHEGIKPSQENIDEMIHTFALKLKKKY